MEKTGRTLNNWKWNYLQENLPIMAGKLPANHIDQRKPPIATKSPSLFSSSKPPVPKPRSPPREKIGVIQEHPALKKNYFSSDFGAFSITSKTNDGKVNYSEYTEYDIKETKKYSKGDVLKETSLLGDEVKETRLIGTDDESNDDFNKSYLSLDGRDETESVNQNGRKHENLDLHNERSSVILETEQDMIDDFLRVDNNGHSDLLTFVEESDYGLTTDDDTMDSGIFPNKETEYFQVYVCL